VANKGAPGDVHAKVEETEVSWGLKVLVVVLFLALVALLIYVILMVNQMGLLTISGLS
jgi:hypothetical protein